MPCDKSRADPLCLLPREMSISKYSVSQKCCPATLSRSLGCFPLSPSSPPPAGLCVPSVGHVLAPSEQRGRGQSSETARSAPYPRVASEAVGAGLNTPWNSFSLQTQPVSLAPWPLRVMLFTIKIGFVRYTVPLARRPGSLCSFL